MMFSIPIAYRAKVVRKRHTKEETLTFWENLEIDIPSLEDWQAPVAASWNDTRPEGLGLPLQSLDEWGRVLDAVTDVRHHDGSHWWPVTMRGRRHDGPLEVLTPERLAEFGSRYVDVDKIPFGGNMKLRAHVGIDAAAGPNPLDPADFRAVISSDLDAMVEGFSGDVDNLIAVEGRIYRRGAEPVYYIKHVLPDDNDDLFGIMKIVPADSPEIRNRGLVFRLDRFDDACAYVANRDERRDVDPTERANADRMATVHAPETLVLDDDAEAMISAAGTFVGDMSDKALASLTRQQAMAWFDLAEIRACIENEATRTDPIDDMRRLEEAVSHAIAVWGQGAGPLRPALERWIGRPSASISVEMGL